MKQRHLLHNVYCSTSKMYKNRVLTSTVYRGAYRQKTLVFYISDHDLIVNMKGSRAPSGSYCKKNVALSIKYIVGGESQRVFKRSENFRLDCKLPSLSSSKVQKEINSLGSVQKWNLEGEQVGVALHIYIYRSQFLAYVSGCFIRENKVRLQREVFFLLFFSFLVLLLSDT